jgi:uroporphyrinogen-III decarboxylase
MPRVYNSMKPLAKLPPLTNLGTTTAFFTTLFGSPEFEEFARTMKKAGEEQKKWNQAVGDFGKEMASIGFPEDPFWRGEGGVAPPFSGFSNSFRGFRGVATDMFRQPDKLKAALAKFLEYRIARSRPAVHRDGKPAIGRSGEAHRVSDEFLSKKQFEEFVWPNWKRAIQTTFDLGYDVVAMLWEGRRDNQLEYLNEFPKGKFFLRVQDTNMFLAKEILGDHTCLAGNVPVAMLCAGSPSEVEEYCKKLIQVCGKNGGFILAPSTGGYGEAKLENVKAMIDSVEKYGRY